MVDKNLVMSCNSLIGQWRRQVSKLHQANPRYAMLSINNNLQFEWLYLILMSARIFKGLTEELTRGHNIVNSDRGNNINNQLVISNHHHHHHGTGNF